MSCSSVSWGQQISREYVREFQGIVIILKMWGCDNALISHALLMMDCLCELMGVIFHMQCQDVKLNFKNALLCHLTMIKGQRLRIMVY